MLAGIPKNKTEEIEAAIREMFPDIGFYMRDKKRTDMTITGRASDIEAFQKKIKVLKKIGKVMVNSRGTEAKIVPRKRRVKHARIPEH